MRRDYLHFRASINIHVALTLARPGRAVGAEEDAVATDSSSSVPLFLAAEALGSRWYENNQLSTSDRGSLRPQSDTDN